MSQKSSSGSKLWNYMLELHYPSLVPDRHSSHFRCKRKKYQPLTLLSIKLTTDTQLSHKHYT